MIYSLNFFQQVFAYKALKILTFEQTSEHFDIGTRTLCRSQRSMELCPTRNRPAKKTDMQALAADIQKSPADYQWERASRFKVTQPATTKALKRLNISYKKERCTIRRPVKKPALNASKKFSVMGSRENRLFT